MPTHSTKKTLRRACGAGAVALAAGLTLGVAPATTTAAPSAPAGQTGGSGYLPEHEDTAQNARLKALGDKALAREKAAKSGASGKAVNAAPRVIYYDASGAPTFRAQIDRSAQIWNEATSNIDLRPASSGGRATVTYREGNSSRGSYAITRSPGSGSVFLDFRQNQQYDSQRIATHETGHILGLPDRYSGPCSELMSGGGPGPSCTNTYPNANESARVDAIFGGYVRWSDRLAVAS